MYTTTTKQAESIDSTSITGTFNTLFQALLTPSYTINQLTGDRGYKLMYTRHVTRI